MSDTPSSQKGAALIVALFVMALVAAAAVAMIWRLNTDVTRTQMILTAHQADLYADGVVAWAIDQLNTDWLQQKANPNQLTDKTPLSISDKKDRAEISGTLTDEQGLFNLNNLTDSASQEAFLRLLKNVDPSLDAVTAQDVTAAVIDWISNNARNPAFDEYYLKQKPAYRAPHRLMAHASELRLVRGMTSSLYSKLSPYITALPVITAVNVNNAPVPVLMSLSPHMTREAAKAIELYRVRSPFITPNNFLTLEVVKNNGMAIPADKITVKSDYFRVQSIITLGDERFESHTGLYRSAKDEKPITSIVWHSKGTQ